MRIVFVGTPEVALPSLEALLASTHEVVAVLTRPDAPSGRGRSLHPSPVAARAHDAGLEVLAPQRPRDAEFVERLTALAPDCCPVVAYGALIPQRVLDIPRLGWINLHFSLLPAWRGAAPVQHAILAGDDLTGASTFSLVAEMDAGPVFGTVTESIQPTDTAGDLLERLSHSGARLLLDTLDGLETGALTAVPQPSDGISLAPKITVEDAKIDWRQPGVAIGRRIRACFPAPGAWTLFRGERFKINSAALVNDSEPVAPGELQVGKRFVRVGTASQPLELGEVQPPGKRPMAATDWARGVRFEPGEVLGG